MTSEEALCRLADKPSDPQALESLYTNHRTVIEAAIKKWFGRNTLVPHATRYVLGRIAVRTPAFAPQRQTLEAFVAELANEESKRLHEEIEQRIADFRSGVAKLPQS
jgi:hypothetical protein